MAQLTAPQARLLEEARVGHLATADHRGAPHVIPVCFTLYRDALYSVLDLKPKRTSLTRLKRVKNILSNPQAALIVDHYQEDWQGLWYLLVTGTADLLVDGEERAGAIESLRSKYPQYQEMDIAENPVIRLTPERVVSWGTAPSAS